MIQFILTLLSLGFAYHNTQTSTFNKDNNGQVTTRDIGSGINPEGGVDPGGPGNGGGTTGDTGQLPPPFINP